MVSATVGDTLDKRIGIKNEAVHENSFFGVQILVSNGIKTLLIKETLVPQTVGLSVKQGLDDEKTWIRQWKEAFLQKLFEKKCSRAGYFALFVV